MELSFKLTRDDYLEFIKHTYARMAKIGNLNTKLFIINMFIWAAVTIGFISIYKVFQTTQGDELIHLSIFLVFWSIAAIAVFSSIYYERKYYMYHSLNDDGLFFKNQRVEVSEEGYRVITGGTESFYKWTAILQIENTKNLICMYLDNNQALLIPKRALEGENMQNKLQAYIDDTHISNIESPI